MLRPFLQNVRCYDLGYHLDDHIALLVAFLHVGMRLRHVGKRKYAIDVRGQLSGLHAVGDPLQVGVLFRRWGH